MRNLETVKKFAELLEAKDVNTLEKLISDDFTGKGSKIELDKKQEIEYFKILFTAFSGFVFFYCSQAPSCPAYLRTCAPMEYNANRWSHHQIQTEGLLNR